MPTDEIIRLRYCYDILRRRIADEDGGFAYWQMNLKIATYFLRRYDTEFSPRNWHYKDALLKSDQENISRTHHLLQYRDQGSKSYLKLTRELELELKRRVAAYFESRTKPPDQAA